MSGHCRPRPSRRRADPAALPQHPGYGAGQHAHRAGAGRHRVRRERRRDRRLPVRARGVAATWRPRRSCTCSHDMGIDTGIDLDALIEVGGDWPRRCSGARCRRACCGPARVPDWSEFSFRLSRDAPRSFFRIVRVTPARPLRYQYRVADIVSFLSDGIGHRSESTTRGAIMTGLGGRAHGAHGVPVAVRVRPSASPRSCRPTARGRSGATERRAGAPDPGGACAHSSSAAWPARPGCSPVLPRTPRTGPGGRTGSSLGSSLIGSVGDGDDRPPPVVTGLLKAAAQPLESDRPPHGHRRASSGGVDPRRRPRRSSHGRPGRTTAAHRRPRRPRSARSSTAPVRRHRRSGDAGRLAPAPMPRDPAPDAAVRPTPDVRRLAVQPGERLAGTRDTIADQVARRSCRRGDGRGSGGRASADRPRTTVRTAPAHGSTAPPSPTRHRAAADGGRAGRRSATHPAVTDPRPLRVHLGASAASPTTGSGTPTEGGSAAFLPAAVADSTMACHRLPIATDVEVRRHDAEAPTVSPD